MIAVTGATGHLGQLVISDLLARGTNPKNIIAVVRDRAKAQKLFPEEILIREGNYTQPESLERAFVGVEKLLLISGSDVGQRVSQHTNAINAAKKSKVQMLVYTSILNADKSKMQLATEHLATEKLILASGIPYVILRNSWYIENYSAQLATYLEYGVSGSAQNGKVSAATRADYAAAAVAALLGKAKTNSIYELGGPAFTLTELAQSISEVSGKQVTYHNLPPQEYAQLLVKVGVPEPMAQVLADSDEGIARGELFTERKDLEQLLGRPCTSLKEAIQGELGKIRSVV